MKEIFEIYERWLNNLGLSESTSSLIYKISIFIFFICLAILLFKTVKSLVSYLIQRYVVISDEKKVLKILSNNNIHGIIGYYIPIILVKKSFEVMFPEMEGLLEVVRYISNISIVILLGLLGFRLLNSFAEIYRLKEENKIKPIRGVIQFIQVIIICITSIVCISILFNVSTKIILGSLGAASAILMLVFKDSITGLVAGMQISFNNMVKIGDWVSIDKYGVEGHVIDITLTSVKVKNFDKSVSTIPSYNFVASDSIKNWQEMVEFGNRRIRRSAFVSPKSVKFCDSHMLSKYKEIVDLNKHVTNSETELAKYNEKNNIDNNVIVNNKRQTNLGLFRIYMLEYLNSRNDINKNLSLRVRLNTPTEKGLPIEIICFTNTSNSTIYYEAQSEIFEHLYSSLTYFELEVS